LHQIAAALLAPILVVQGRRVRRTVPRLPEPPGPRGGTTGSGPPLRLLITGDSAAAGVGAEHQSAALSGQLTARLGRHHRVTWRLEARTGWTTGATLRHLRDLPDRPFDVVVTSLGVNDLTAGARRRPWLAQQRALLALCRERFATRHFVVAGLPPVGRFPALPQPLRWVLGRRADAFTRGLELLVDDEADADLADLRFELDGSAMAEDGFHPGPPVYARWAGRATQLIRDSVG
jgi:lysophospholipase L1-like esterase